MSFLSESLRTFRLNASLLRDANVKRAFRESWVRMGDKLCELAAEDESRGRTLSAGEKYARASVYFLTAERMQAHGAQGRAELYRRGLETFARGVELGRENAERVEIPYGNEHLAGWIVKAEGARGPAPSP